MKQIEKQIIITFRWWNDDESAEINPAHAKALEESAIERIVDMMKDGSTSGELVDDDTDPDGITYRGAWELNWKTI